MRLTKLPRNSEITSLGIRLDTNPNAFGELRESRVDVDDMDTLRQRLTDEGYLLLRGLLEPRQVKEAQAQALESLVRRGLVSAAPDHAAVPHASVSKSGFEPADSLLTLVRQLAFSERMMGFYARFLNAEVRALDYLWMRCMAPGQATGPHCDIVYMGRGTTELYTSWIPLTPVTLVDGPLLILERSHRIESIRQGYGRMDIDRDRNWKRLRFRHGRFFRGGDYSRHPRRLQKGFGLRWLTSEFDPGDVLIFTSFTMHGSLDNRSNKFRISTDARFQRASDPVDERWIGERPIGHSR